LAAAEPRDTTKPVPTKCSNGCQAGRLMVRTYAIPDLLLSEAAHTKPHDKQTACKLPSTPCCNDAATQCAASCCSAAATPETGLIKLIQHAIGPAAWHDRGGEGTIDYFSQGMTLVVRQTPEIHEQVADLLTALRRAQDIRVAFDLRLVTATEEAF